MPWTVFFWAFWCSITRHKWGPWKPLSHERLVEASRCRCGVERTRRAGLVASPAPDWRAARAALDRAAR